MPNYIASVFLAADRPFGLAAAEINKLIAPHVMRVTDRFDEVPGYAAEFDDVKVELQGMPADVTAEDIGEEPIYYLNVRLEVNAPHEFPSWLGDAQPSAPETRGGYIDLSACLARQVQKVTNLRCVDER